MVKSHAANRKAEPFRSQVLRYRGRTGLTQHDLANRMGASRRTVQDWESGSNYPKAERLKVFILALLEAGGLTVGDEREEAQELWAAVLRDSPRMRSPLDEVWLTRVLADRAAPRQPPEVVPDVAPFAIARSAAEREAVERREDWGEAPDVLGFVGRGEELTTLRAWVLEERSRLVAVLGIGGIG